MSKSVDCRIAIVAFAAVTIGTIANAQSQASPTTASIDGCASYVGQQFTPTEPETVIRALELLAPKDQFESTQAYITRARASLGPLAEPFVIAGDTFTFIRYDAESEKIPSWGISYSPVDYNSSFGIPTYRNSSSLPWAYDPNVTHMGFRLTHTGKHVLLLETLSVEIDGNPNFVGQGHDIPMSPDVARATIPSARFAYAVTLTPPYAPMPGTFSDPGLNTQSYSIIAADIHCALVLDPSGRAFAARQTH